MTGEVTELTGEPASGKTQVTRHDIVTRPAAHIDTYLLEYLSLFPCMLHTHIDTSTPPSSSIYFICLSSPRPCILHTHIDTSTPPSSSIYFICLSSPAPHSYSLAHYSHCYGTPSALSQRCSGCSAAHQLYSVVDGLQWRVQCLATPHNPHQGGCH